MYAFRAAAAAKDAKRQIDQRDEETGERILANRRSIASKRRALSDQALKALLAEDLNALLNTINLESSDPDLVDGLDHVKRSILNFGLRDLSDKTIDETIKIGDIRRDLLDTLRRFEPRLLRNTIVIERDTENEADLTIRFVVRSDMRADPVPTSVEFVTEVELDSGEIRIAKL